MGPRCGRTAVIQGTKFFQYLPRTLSRICRLPEYWSSIGTSVRQRYFAVRRACPAPLARRTQANRTVNLRHSSETAKSADSFKGLQMVQNIVEPRQTLPIQTDGDV
jgi:hypothetical protein